MSGAAASVEQHLDMADFDSYIPFYIGNGDIGGTFDPFCGTTVDQLAYGNHREDDIRTQLLTNLIAQDYWEEVTFDPDRYPFSPPSAAQFRKRRDSGQGYSSALTRYHAFDIFIGREEDAFPFAVEGHRQALDYATGVLQTAYTYKGRRCETSLFIHPDKSVLVYRLRGGGESVLRVDGNLSKSEADGTLLVESRSNAYCPAAAAVGTHGGVVRDGKVIIPAGKDCSVYVAYGHRALGEPRVLAREGLAAALAKGHAALRRENDAWWSARWARFALALSDERIEAMWKRGIFYLICSMPRRVRDGTSGEPGLAGVFPAFGVGYHIQDGVYQLWPLLTTNNADLVEPSLDWLLAVLPVAREHARSFFWKKGASYVWHGGPGMFPFIPGHKHHSVCMHEHHVNGWVVFLVERFLNAKGWEKALVEKYYPIVAGIAEFFSSLLEPAGAGLGIRYVPSASQGESGQLVDKPNIFDVLAAAKLSLRMAVRMGRQAGLTDPNLERWAREARQLSLDILRRADGVYLYHEGDPGITTKLPVQFMGVLFDVGVAPADILTTYEYLKGKVRHGCCSFGPAYTAIAMARLKQADRALENVQMLFDEQYQYTRPPYLMFRECAPDWLNTRLGRMPYFMTVYGLFTQAVNEMLIQDWQGRVELFPACPFEAASFRLNGLGQVREGRMCQAPALPSAGR